MFIFQFHPYSIVPNKLFFYTNTCDWWKYHRTTPLPRSKHVSEGCFSSLPLPTTPFPLPRSKREMEGFSQLFQFPTPLPHSKRKMEGLFPLFLTHNGSTNPSLTRNARRRGFPFSLPTMAAPTPPLLETQDGGVISLFIHSQPTLGLETCLTCFRAPGKVFFCYTEAWDMSDVFSSPWYVFFSSNLHFPPTSRGSDASDTFSSPVCCFFSFFLVQLTYKLQ